MFGVNLHIDEKIEPIATALFRNKEDNRLAIFYYDNKESCRYLYYVEPYTQ
jgi:hypothetical protein